MEHKQIFCSSVVPHLSPRHSWCVAQNSEAEKDDGTQVHIFYNLHDPMYYYRCQIPELLGKRIRGCFHGCWAILSSIHPRDVMWSLWNPFTSQIINLPPLIRKVSEEDYDDITYCCLSAPPDHPNSVLLLTRTKKPNIVYCRIGRDPYFQNARKRMKFRWAEKTFSKQVRSVTSSDGSFHGLTCCNSKVYAYFIVSDRSNYSLLLVEFDIVVNDCKNKKLKEVVITLLPVLDFPCPRIVDSTSVPLLKGSCSELFTIVLGLKEDKWSSTSVSDVYVFKLDMDNMRWEEMEDLKDTILSVEFATDSSACYSPAIASSELGGYIHIVADDGKIIYSYHVKDKTISLSSIPCLAGKNHVSAWAMLECTSLKSDRVYLDCKQEKEGDKGDGILVRSVKGNHQVESHLPSFQFRDLTMNEFCVGLVENSNRLESENTDSKQGAKDVNRIVRPVKGDEDESHLLNLPTHVLEMMLMEFCVGVEYLKFRSTCKRCHLAAPLIPWNNGKASARLREYSLLSPWLIVFDKHKGIITFTDPVSDDKYYIKTPQELICDLEIKDSRYGWLLILKSGGSLVFYNPFTSDIRKLPQLHDSDIFSFSAPPTSPGCMVVGITIDIYHYHVCIHFVGGEPSWRKILLDIYGDDCFSSLTLFGRDLYALRDDRGLDVFKEIGREDHLWKPNAAKAPTNCCKSLSQSFLLRCDQHLLHVIVGKFGESVEVFKLNDSTQEWVKLDSLGKHVIFICGMSSVCIDAKKPHMENKIFFPRLPIGNENGNHILFYSLETCRYHTFSNENYQESFGDFFGTKHLLTPHAWVEPTWS
ncbi:hypothetical protein CTI12_AA009940 [Artemisia annua]|uniref:KIB1-4 beta-propeller domain-containing protein n=1 Tax=Artemisia annua TaxID=35608 RepID=A0A2U1QMW4_ARTAN|nr:hypothetical protein CTI12_AA009940 [Artemisia annua]